MTLTEFCELYKDKDKEYPVSKSFCVRGYMQKTGGYINIAKSKKIEIDATKAEPNQKWHLFNSYCTEKNISRDAKECYMGLKCPELLLWMAEAAGFDVTDAAENAIRIIDSGVGGKKRNAAGLAIKKEFTFEMLLDKLTKTE